MAERLRIVPQDLWERVKARQKARSEDIGESVRRGHKAAAQKRTGRKPKFLFSGLLQCGLCGARFVIADRAHYACSSRVHSGESACASGVRIKRTLVESGLLAGIKRDLLAPEVVEEIRRYIKQSLRALSRASTPGPSACRTWSGKLQIWSRPLRAAPYGRHPRPRNDSSRPKPSLPV